MKWEREEEERKNEKGEVIGEKRRRVKTEKFGHEIGKRKDVKI